MLWDKQAPCHRRGTDSRERDLEGRTAICTASEDSSVQFSFPKLFGGGQGIKLFSPSPAGKEGTQVQWDEFRTTQFKLLEVTSEQGLYQAVSGGLQEGLKAPPVRTLKSKQENGPCKCNMEISLTLDWE